MKKKNLLDTLKTTINPKASAGLTDDIRLELDRYIQDNYIPSAEPVYGAVDAEYAVFANALPPELLESPTEEEEEFVEEKCSLPYGLKTDRPDHEIAYSKAGVSVEDYINSSPKAEKKSGLPNISFTSGNFAKESSLEEHLRLLDVSFSDAMLDLIDAKGMKDSEVYRRAGIDRRHFSKMRNRNYHPSKSTVLALCIGMSLTKDESDALLEKAGYTLSRSSMQDLIVEYFLVNKNWDIDAVNQSLYEHDQPLLGF